MFWGKIQETRKGVYVSKMEVTVSGRRDPGPVANRSGKKTKSAFKKSCEWVRVGSGLGSHPSNITGPWMREAIWSQGPRTKTSCQGNLSI